MSSSSNGSSFSLAGTDIGKQLQHFSTSSSHSNSNAPLNMVSNQGSNYTPYTSPIKLEPHPSTAPGLVFPKPNRDQKPAGFLFVCPADAPSQDCKFLHAMKRNPGPRAYAAQIMDHIRIDRKNTHLDGSALTEPEKQAVNTQVDPYGSYYIRSGDDRSLFLPGGVFTQWGAVLVYFPDAIWNGEAGDWDIITLAPDHRTDLLDKFKPATSSAHVPTAY